MKKKQLFTLMLAGAFLFVACNDKKTGVPPEITSTDVLSSVFMADSVQFSATVNSKSAMNAVMVSFWNGDTQVSERIIPAKESGTYGTKLYVPHIKEMADGPMDIKIIARNSDFDYSTKTVSIQVVRPEYPYLTLKTAEGDFQMEPVDGEPYKYAVSHAFSTQSLQGVIEAPAFGEKGNKILFGGSPVKSAVEPTEIIQFETDVAVGSEYEVTFNTQSYAFEPFVMPSINGVEFSEPLNGMAVAELELEQNGTIGTRGIRDIADWWLNPSFIDKNDDNTLKFRAATGKYRVTMDSGLKYFKFEPMNGDALADFDPDTKTGGIWVNGGRGRLSGTAGDDGFGFPSMAANPCRWDATKNIAMAPMGGGIYVLKVVAGQTLFQGNVSGSTAGIVFFANSRSKSNPLALDFVQSLYGSPGTPGPGGGIGALPNLAPNMSARFEIWDGHADSNNAPIVCTGSNRTLGAGRTYVFTLDVNHSPVQLSISLQEE